METMETSNGLSLISVSVGTGVPQKSAHKLRNKISFPIPFVKQPVTLRQQEYDSRHDFHRPYDGGNDRRK
jgi:hypothetical protein